MNETLFEKLIEIAWRRKLTAEEEAQLQAWLARHPEDVERWEMEAGLSGALESVRQVAPSSNFTNCVLQRVELDARASSRKPPLGERVRRWLTRTAVGPRWVVAGGLVAVTLTFFVVQHRHQVEPTSGEVQSVTVASSEILEDFDAIREFSHAVADMDDTDEALFTLLTK